MSKSVFRVTAVYFVAHVLLLIAFDTQHPEAFLRGDRSLTRIAQIERVLAADDFSSCLSEIYSYGLPGDYLWQAAFYRVGQMFGSPVLCVIAAQIVLASLSLLAVAAVTFRLSGSEQATTIACVMYACLPHMVAYPHMLVSEAVFVPLCIFATALTVSYLADGTRRDVVLAAAMWALAALTRPTALLLPAIVAVYALVTAPRAWRTHVFFVLISLLLLSSWFVPSYVVRGEWNISNGDPSMLGRTLQSKADYLVTVLSGEDRVQEAHWLESKKLEEFRFADLTSLYSRHVGKALQIMAIESAKLALKFDETKVLNYLGIWEAETEWGKHLVEDPMGTVGRNKIMGLVVGVGALVWILVLLLAVYGIAARNLDRKVLFFLVCYSVCSLAATLVVDYSQGRHRFPVDFAIVAFAACGIVRILHHTKG
jgi:hypothetical protein